MKWSLSVTNRDLYLTVGADTLTRAVSRHAVA
jgi:hypothetical protein